MKKRRVSLLLASQSRGQTLTEFAMGLTVFSLLVYGIMQMALAVNAYNAMSTAAREAARYAIVHSPTSASNNSCPSGTGAQCTQVQNVAPKYAPFLSMSGCATPTNSPPCDVSATFTNPTSNSQDYAVVVITHTYPLSIPFLSAVNLNLSASSKMLVSQ
jgi:Flp pilus assembly protein TadG